MLTRLLLIGCAATFGAPVCCGLSPHWAQKGAGGGGATVCAATPLDKSRSMPSTPANTETLFFIETRFIVTPRTGVILKLGQEVANCFQRVLKLRTFCRCEGTNAL